MSVCKETGKVLEKFRVIYRYDYSMTKSDRGIIEAIDLRDALMLAYDDDRSAICISVTVTHLEL